MKFTMTVDWWFDVKKDSDGDYVLSSHSTDGNTLELVIRSKDERYIKDLHENLNKLFVPGQKKDNSFIKRLIGRKE